MVMPYIMLLIPVAWLLALFLFAMSPFSNDLSMNGLAIVVIVWLIGMIVALVFAVWKIDQYLRAEHFKDCMVLYENAARCTYEARWQP